MLAKPQATKAFIRFNDSRSAVRTHRSAVRKTARTDRGRGKLLDLLRMRLAGFFRRNRNAWALFRVSSSENPSRLTALPGEKASQEGFRDVCVSVLQAGVNTGVL